jgi:hypothetical protein
MIALGRTGVGWADGLLDGRSLRLRLPMGKAGEILSLRAGGEVIAQLPPPQDIPLLELITRYEVGEDTQRVSLPAEGTRVSGGAPQIEGTVKSVAQTWLGTIDVLLATVAGYVPGLRKQDLADISFLQSMISTKLVEALNYSLAAYVMAVAQSDTDIPTVLGSWRSAVTAVEQTGYDPNGIVLNPADWETIETALVMGIAPVTADEDGDYSSLLGPMRVVTMPQQPAGKALVGDLHGLSLITQPEATIAISGENDQDFVNNTATMRADQLAGVAVQGPQRLRWVTLA